MNEATQKLAMNVKSVAEDTREVIARNAERMADAVTSAGEKTRSLVDDVQLRISGATQAAAENVRNRARATDQYVHASPWTFIGAAALIGAAVGYVLARR